MIGINKRNKAKSIFVIIIFIILIVFNTAIYALDKLITPTVIAVADAEMRVRTLQIINQIILDEFTREFNYDEIVKIEKDDSGNITMIRADTLKLNNIACNVAIKSQKELNRLGIIGIKIPFGYIFRNNILAYIGPNVTIKMQPIGGIETNYISQFEGAGINQTRHKIYIELKTNIRVIIPFRSNDIEVKNEIPIAETIIVGKIPDTAINLDLKGADFKLK